MHGRARAEEARPGESRRSVVNIWSRSRRHSTALIDTKLEIGFDATCIDAGHSQPLTSLTRKRSEVQIL